jgi:arsenite methyltransferase
MTRSRHESSRGAVLSDAAWLDMHLEACRKEYTEMAGWVGFQPEWSVLDVGCGSGSFVPILRETISGGRLHGCDIDPENARLATERGLDSATAASVTALPYADAAFDAVWCANVVEFLTPVELHAAACELRRVVRRGGLVALKDMDVQLLRIHPADPHLPTRLSMAHHRRALDLAAGARLPGRAPAGSSPSGSRPGGRRPEDLVDRALGPPPTGRA